MATHHHTAPVLSFDDAMEWCVSESDDEPLRWTPLRDCHASRLRELVLRAIAGHPAEQDVRAIMSGLLLRYHPDKWYLCVQLLDRGIPLPGRAAGKLGLAEWREKQRSDGRAS
jgi:hypothetical protein